MKWPLELSLIRHGESEYNILSRENKNKPEYKSFKNQFDKEWVQLRKDKLKILDNSFPSSHLVELAREAEGVISLPFTDFDTPLTKMGEGQAVKTGKKLSEHIALPNVVLVSPYLRTIQTLDGLKEGWPQLKEVPIVYEDRIREQEHGLRTLLSDQRLSNLFHPIEGLQAEQENRYTHRYLGGESLMDVRARVGDVLNTLTREYSGKNVLTVTHHLLIMGFRSKLERWSPEEFLEANKNNRPKNCGLTTYIGNPNEGSNGKLNLKHYNLALWEK